MNLIDFTVKEIISEKYARIYELFGMTEEEAIKDDHPYLFHDGCMQTILTVDMGGKQEEHFIHDLNLGYKPFKVGDRGLH